MDNHEVVCINWVERERGWGMRPDGHTLYLTKAAADAHIKRTFDEREGKSTPNEYSNPGEPFITTVDSETYEKIKENDAGYIWGHYTQHKPR